MLTNLAAEFIGTTVLISCIFIFKEPIGIVLALLGLIYAFRNFSGAHFNPAVSLAFLLKGHIKLSTFLYYVLAQFAGATCAFFIWKQTLKINKI